MTLPAATIHRDSPVPFYFQLAERLEQRSSAAGGSRLRCLRSSTSVAISASRARRPASAQPARAGRARLPAEGPRHVRRETRPHRGSSSPRAGSSRKRSSGWGGESRRVCSRVERGLLSWACDALRYHREASASPWNACARSTAKSRCTSSTIFPSAYGRGDLARERTSRSTSACGSSTVSRRRAVGVSSRRCRRRISSRSCSRSATLAARLRRVAYMGRLRSALRLLSGLAPERLYEDRDRGGRGPAVRGRVGLGRRKLCAARQ